MLTIGKSEISQLVSSLNRFGAYPREGHLDLAFRSFGYTKTTMHKQIAIDLLTMESNRSETNFKKLIPDFKQDYPDTKEEMDPGFASSFGPVLQTTILVDTDHAHDQLTRRSLTGMIGYVGSTPVTWGSKRQGSIFFVLCTAIEFTM